MAGRKKKGNIFLRMHPLQRILFSLVITGITWPLIRNEHFNWKLNAIALWDVFALSYTAASWIVFFTSPVDAIAKKANTEDGSRLLVLISIMISSFGGIFTVMLLMISNAAPPEQEMLRVVLSVSGMMASWLLLHTIFTFHYAHLYYFTDEDHSPANTALDFPKEKNPDYLDFAYFAFVIGMTFQVSDVQINSRITRRTALAHGLLAFALNTFVVALTINLIAGLKK